MLEEYNTYPIFKALSSQQVGCTPMFANPLDLLFNSRVNLNSFLSILGQSPFVPWFLCSYWAFTISLALYEVLKGKSPKKYSVGSHSEYGSAGVWDTDKWNNVQKVGVAQISMSENSCREPRVDLHVDRWGWLWYLEVVSKVIDKGQ